MVSLARDRNTRVVFVPSIDAPEAAIVEGLEIIPVGSLAELVNHLRGHRRMTVFERDGL